MRPTGKTRTEKDSMGEVRLPASALYGASTQRAMENFHLEIRRFSGTFIRALGLVKWAAAVANGRLKQVPPKLAAAVAAKALEVAEGRHDEHFPLEVFQTGSGTSTNMNANEVIANLANRSLGGGIGSHKPVHPNDHVNRGQSTNDVFPTALHVAAVLEIRNSLIPALGRLERSLGQKAKAFRKVMKIGRTHLQDATPITLGQEFSGYAAQIQKSIVRIQLAEQGLHELAIGGTAVGTGINTHPKFSRTVCRLLSQKTGVKFREASNHFEAQASKDAAVFMSGALKTFAVSLMKICNDLRWLASGPRTGFHEIHLPELQPGSSIMPGKVNPVIPEVVCQIAAHVMGNDLAATIGGQFGNFELNVMMPMMATNLLESIELLAGACRHLDEKCIRGIAANREVCESMVEKSLALVTALTPVIGYDRAAALSKQAYRENKTIRQLLMDQKVLPPPQIKKLLDPWKMIAPR